jgi:hypothetical protein
LGSTWASADKAKSARKNDAAKSFFMGPPKMDAQ